MDRDKIDAKITKSGTTTIGIVCKDGIVMAADTRASAGYPNMVMHKRMEKVFAITDTIAVTTAGNVSDIQFVLKLIKAELKMKQLRTKTDAGVKEAASLLAMLSYENIRKFSTIPGIAAFLVGGVDKKGFWLFEVPPDGALMQHKDYVCDGSGSVFAMGVFEDSYKQDITTQDGVKLAIRAISAAMQRDTATGSGIDVVVIDKKGAKKVFSEEVKQVLTKK